MSILDADQSARYIDSLTASVQALEADLAATRDRLRQAEAERDEARAFGERAAAVANNQLVTCAFCGAEYPRGTPRHGDGDLAAHIQTCEYHPMRVVESELEQAQARIAALEQGQFGWLIESGPRPEYWDGHSNDSWTSDAFSAVRFARFEDAESIRCWLIEGGKHCRSAQHGFVAQADARGREEER